MGGDTEQEVGAALGTVPYTAPEVFDTGRPTTSSDVYAFGILRERQPLHFIRSSFQ